MQIPLNESQRELISSLLEFYESDETYYVISGQAGVGKTTCVKYFIDKWKKIYPYKKCACSAPTNKATSVLRDTVGRDDIDYRTIYSILGLKMEPNGAIKELKDTGATTIEGYSVVIIDEGSMISEELLEYIQSKTVLSGTKIIIIGDRGQLPPVGEPVSPIWNHFKTNFELTEVVRHKNSILTFVQSIRNNPIPEFISPGEEVIIHSDVGFMDAVKSSARAGEFHNGTAKAIAWRNVTVDFLNKLIRESYDSTVNLQFVSGDRVVFKEPVTQKLGKNVVFLAHTDQEGVITSATATFHRSYPMLKTWKLDVKLDNGKTLTSYVIHAAARQLLEDMLKKYADGKKWYPFWQMKEAFHQVAHGFALTTHRSQGSTFQKIFIEAGDILLNRSVDERTKCLYVACSRASKELHVFPP
jgi:exodeoxyribonuclease-5